MSNPVSQADVEDVLASIRRLVSDNNRSGISKNETKEADAKGAASSPDAKADGAGDKLVLTPALRVAPEDQAGAPADQRESDDPGPVWLAPDMLRTGTPQQGFAESQTPYLLRDPALPVDRADPAGSVDEDTADATSDAQNAGERKDAEKSVADWIMTTEFAEGSPEMPLGSGDDESDAAADMQQRDVDPGDAEQVNATRPVTVANAESDDVVSASVEPTPPDGPRGIGNDDSQAELGAKIAALEAVIAKRKDQWEPDGVDADPYSGTAPPMIDWMPDEVTELPHFASTRAEPEPEAPVAEQVPTPESQSDLPQAAATNAVDSTEFIDEDTLQQIVARIVREELQGPLGERITRNVRMLVRREIQRALVSRDFD